MPQVVLPLIDRQTGQVQFSVRGRWITRYVERPAELERLMARAARRPEYDQGADQLLICVPARRQPEGRVQAFSLAKFPAASALAKLGG